MFKKILYLVTGLAVIILGIGVQAISLEASGPQEFHLQQGTDYDFTLNVDVNKTPVELRTAVIQPTEDKVEILAGTPLIRMYASTAKIPFKIIVGNEAKGTYAITIKLTALSGEENAQAEHTVYVHTEEREKTMYLTSPQYNTIPDLSLTGVSKKVAVLGLNDTTIVNFTIENSGSKTNFYFTVINHEEDIVATVDPAYTVINEQERKVVSLHLETKGYTAPGKYVIGLKAEEEGHRREFALGEVEVIVKPFYDLSLVLPATSLNIEEGAKKQAFLIVTNKSLAGQKVSFSASSGMINFYEDSVLLAPKEERKVAFDVRGSRALGTYTIVLEALGEEDLVRAAVLKVNLVEPGSEISIEPLVIEKDKIIKNNTKGFLADVHIVVLEAPEDFGVEVKPSVFDLEADEEKNVTITIHLPEPNAKGKVVYAVKSGTNILSQDEILVGEPLMAAGMVSLAYDAMLGAVIGLMLFLVYVLLQKRKEKALEEEETAQAKPKSKA